LNGIGLFNIAKYHAVTGEERCQIFGPVETKTAGAGRGQVGAEVSEAKTFFGPKSKALRVSSRIKEMALFWTGKVNRFGFVSTRSNHVPVFDIRMSKLFRSERDEHRLSLLYKCVLGPVELSTARLTLLGKKMRGSI
jgi:hypothetical protein